MHCFVCFTFPLFWTTCFFVRSLSNSIDNLIFRSVWPFCDCSVVIAQLFVKSQNEVPWQKAFPFITWSHVDKPLKYFASLFLDYVRPRLHFFVVRFFKFQGCDLVSYLIDVISIFLIPWCVLFSIPAFVPDRFPWQWKKLCLTVIGSRHLLSKISLTMQFLLILNWEIDQ